MLKLHIEFSVLCLITFIGFAKVFKDTMLKNGWLKGEKKKITMLAYGLFFVPFINILCVVFEIFMVCVSKEKFDEMYEEAKENADV